MKPLSRPLSAIKETYDAVVVGSGYGAGVAASRLARMGLSVCVLERGREILPGQFPKSLRLVDPSGTPYPDIDFLKCNKIWLSLVDHVGQALKIVFPIRALSIVNVVAKDPQSRPFSTTCRARHTHNQQRHYEQQKMFQILHLGGQSVFWSVCVCCVRDRIQDEISPQHYSIESTYIHSPDREVQHAGEAHPSKVGHHQPACDL